MKSNDFNKLTQKQSHVLPYLVTCLSYEEAARQSHVSVKQITSWLKDPYFIKELNHQRKEVFSNAIRLLKAASQKAVLTLVECLNDSNAKNRISAADKILSHTLKGMELFELEERLSSAERRIEEEFNESPKNKEA